MLGLSLIEIIVTLIVITTGIVGVAYGFSSIIRTAAIAQDNSQLEAGIRQLSDFVRSSDVALQGRGLKYQPCADAAAYSAALNASIQTKHIAPPPGVAWTIAEVFIPRSRSAPPSNPCGDWGVQEITITATTDGRLLSRVVWKGAA